MDGPVETMTQICMELEIQQLFPRLLSGFWGQFLLLATSISIFSAKIIENWKYIALDDQSSIISVMRKLEIFQMETKFEGQKTGQSESVNFSKSAEEMRCWSLISNFK